MQLWHHSVSLHLTCKPVSPHILGPLVVVHHYRHGGCHTSCHALFCFTLRDRASIVVRRSLIPHCRAQRGNGSLSLHGCLTYFRGTVLSNKLIQMTYLIVIYTQEILKTIWNILLVERTLIGIAEYLPVRSSPDTMTNPLLSPTLKM